MRKKRENTEVHDDGTYVVKKSRKSSIFAFVLCVLIAFVIWAYAEATEDQITVVTDTATDTSAQ